MLIVADSASGKKKANVAKDFVISITMKTILELQLFHVPLFVDFATMNFLIKRSILLSPSISL